MSIWNSSKKISLVDLSAVEILKQYPDRSKFLKLSPLEQAQAQRRVIAYYRGLQQEPEKNKQSQFDQVVGWLKATKTIDPDKMNEEDVEKAIQEAETNADIVEETTRQSRGEVEVKSPVQEYRERSVKVSEYVQQAQASVFEVLSKSLGRTPKQQAKIEEQLKEASKKHTPDASYNAARNQSPERIVGDTLKATVLKDETVRGAITQVAEKESQTSGLPILVERQKWLEKATDKALQQKARGQVVVQDPVERARVAIRQATLGLTAEQALANKDQDTQPHSPVDQAIEALIEEPTLATQLRAAIRTADQTQRREKIGKALQTNGYTTEVEQRAQILDQALTGRQEPVKAMLSATGSTARIITSDQTGAEAIEDMITQTGRPVADVVEVVGELDKIADTHRQQIQSQQTKLRTTIQTKVFEAAGASETEAQELVQAINKNDVQHLERQLAQAGDLNSKTHAQKLVETSTGDSQSFVATAAAVFEPSTTTTSPEPVNIIAPEFRQNIAQVNPQTADALVDSFEKTLAASAPQEQRPQIKEMVQAHRQPLLNLAQDSLEQSGDPNKVVESFTAGVSVEGSLALELEKVTQLQARSQPAKITDIRTVYQAQGQTHPVEKQAKLEKLAEHLEAVEDESRLEEVALELLNNELGPEQPKLSRDELSQLNSKDLSKKLRDRGIEPEQSNQIVKIAAPILSIAPTPKTEETDLAEATASVLEEKESISDQVEALTARYAEAGMPNPQETAQKVVTHQQALKEDATQGEVIESLAIVAKEELNNPQSLNWHAHNTIVEGIENAEVVNPSLASASYASASVLPEIKIDRSHEMSVMREMNQVLQGSSETEEKIARISSQLETYELANKNLTKQELAETIVDRFNQTQTQLGQGQPLTHEQAAILGTVYTDVTLQVRNIPLSLDEIIGVAVASGQPFMGLTPDDSSELLVTELQSRFGIKLQQDGANEMRAIINRMSEVNSIGLEGATGTTFGSYPISTNKDNFDPSRFAYVATAAATADNPTGLGLGHQSILLKADALGRARDYHNLQTGITNGERGFGIDSTVVAAYMYDVEGFNALYALTIYDWNQSGFIQHTISYNDLAQEYTTWSIPTGSESTGFANLSGGDSFVLVQEWPTGLPSIEAFGSSGFVGGIEGDGDRQSRGPSLGDAMDFAKNLNSLESKGKVLSQGSKAAKATNRLGQLAKGAKSLFDLSKIGSALSGLLAMLSSALSALIAAVTAALGVIMATIAALAGVIGGIVAATIMVGIGIGIFGAIFYVIVLVLHDEVVSAGEYIVLTKSVEEFRDGDCANADVFQNIPARADSPTEISYTNEEFAELDMFDGNAAQDRCFRYTIKIALKPDVPEGTVIDLRNGAVDDTFTVHYEEGDLIGTGITLFRDSSDIGNPSNQGLIPGVTFSDPSDPTSFATELRDGEVEELYLSYVFDPILDTDDSFTEEMARDVAIHNHFHLQARFYDDAGNEKSVAFNTEANIYIGDAPRVTSVGNLGGVGCFVFSDGWNNADDRYPSDTLEQLNNAATHIMAKTGAEELICKGGTVTIYEETEKYPSGYINGGGINPSSDNGRTIVLGPRAFGAEGWARTIIYTLAHEASHSIDFRNSFVRSCYSNSGAAYEVANDSCADCDYDILPSYPASVYTDPERRRIALITESRVEPLGAWLTLPEEHSKLNPFATNYPVTYAYANDVFTGVCR